MASACAAGTGAADTQHPALLKNNLQFTTRVRLPSLCTGFTEDNRPEGCAPGDNSHIAGLTFTWPGRCWMLWRVGRGQQGLCWGRAASPHLVPASSPLRFP